MLLRCESLDPPMSQMGRRRLALPFLRSQGHSLQVRPRPLVHKCPLCIDTDRKFWALGFVAICQLQTSSPSPLARAAPAMQIWD